MKLSTLASNVLVMLAIRVTTVRGDPPTICVSSPAITVQAGSVLKATIDNPQARLCKATLTFSNPFFQPIYFGFKPLKCLGLQEADVTVPLEVPNGDAFIFWECAGQGSQTCNRALITGGLEEPGSIVLEQQGAISCLVPATTLTSFSTSFSASTTVMDKNVVTGFSTSAISSMPSSTNVLTAVSVQTTASFPIISPSGYESSSMSTPSSAASGPVPPVKSASASASSAAQVEPSVSTSYISQTSGVGSRAVTTTSQQTTYTSTNSQGIPSAEPTTGELSDSRASGSSSFNTICPTSCGAAITQTVTSIQTSTMVKTSAVTA